MQSKRQRLSRDFVIRDGSDRRLRLALGERERASLPALLQVHTYEHHHVAQITHRHAVTEELGCSAGTGCRI
jgi:hypothetical protein